MPGYPDTTTVSATIAAGGSLSGEVTLPLGYYLAALVMPSAWTAADLTFQISADNATFADFYDNAGVEITVPAAASRAIMLDSDTWRAVRFLKVRSGTSATPVNQSSSRTITLICRMAQP